jgi:hypothetical protein
MVDLRRWWSDPPGHVDLCLEQELTFLPGASVLRVIILRGIA